MLGRGTLLPETVVPITGYRFKLCERAPGGGGPGGGPGKGMPGCQLAPSGELRPESVDTMSGCGEEELEELAGNI
jgi:hypothetical protein